MRAHLILLLAIVCLSPGCGGADPPIVGQPAPVEPAFFTGAIGLSPEEEASIPKELDFDLVDRQDRALPASAQVSNLPPPADQGRVGSCAALAAGYAVGTQSAARQAGIDPSQEVDQTNPAWLYRRVLQLQGSNDCVGSNPALYLETLVEKGSPTRASIAYPLPNLDEKLACQQILSIDTALPQDFRFIAGSYAMLPGGSSLVDQIKGQVSENRAVVYSTSLAPDFFRYRAGVYRQQESFGDGGHAMAVVGYDDSLQAFRIMNSWAPGLWGEGGFAWVSYDSFVRGVEAFQGECLVLHPLVRQPVDATGGKLIPKQASAPGGELSQAVQKRDRDGVSLLLSYYFEGPIQPQTLLVRSPSGVTAVQTFGSNTTLTGLPTLRSGVFSIRRAEANQFPPGVYQVTLTTLAPDQSQFLYTGSFNLEALPTDPALPAADLDGMNEQGTTGTEITITP
ncbi:MAG: hypothetical protein AMXMBFR33_63980 [Candidatus Xenobia bacterium]